VLMAATLSSSCRQGIVPPDSVRKDGKSAVTAGIRPIKTRSRYATTGLTLIHKTENPTLRRRGTTRSAMQEIFGETVGCYLISIVFSFENMRNRTQAIAVNPKVNFTTVRSIAGYLIHIVRLLRLTHLRGVDLQEIDRAAKRWAAYKGPHRRKKAGPRAADCFAREARNWLRFHGNLAIPVVAPHPSDMIVRDFVQHLVRMRTQRSPKQQGKLCAFSRCTG
jgi:hypothetical protein